MVYLSARLLNTGASPFCMFRNAIELLPEPSSRATPTNGYRSLRQPEGLSGVAFATLQSDCCHMWNRRCTMSPVKLSYGRVGLVLGKEPFSSVVALGTRVSVVNISSPLAPVRSSPRSPGSRDGSRMGRTES